MFGVRLTSLFTSRWMALLWAILVILTAINYVGTDDDKGQDDQAAAAAADGLTPEQRQAIKNAL
jgi:hypothetical protein